MVRGISNGSAYPWLVITADDDELIPVVEADDQPDIVLHPPPLSLVDL
jgi:hypothetical protein